jgi:endonuclease/exonuclease/phosphatase (EEP) superfamily protein YafD
MNKKYTVTSFTILFILLFLFCSSVSNYLNLKGPRFSGNFVNGTAPFNDTLKVISFNIKLAKKVDQAILELYEMEEFKNVDIILLQEMDDEGTEKMAKILEYNYVYYPASVHSKHHQNMGNAVLTKWPILRDKKIILPYENPKNKQRRIAVVASILINETEVLVYSVHTEVYWLNNEDERIEQADSIGRSIPDSAKFVLIGGDFNTLFPRVIETLDEKFLKYNLVRSTKGIGSTQKIGPIGFTFDHIYSRGFRMVNGGKFTHTRASDHYPIWIELVFE